MTPRLAIRLLEQHRFLRFCLVGGIGFVVDAGLLLALLMLAPGHTVSLRLVSIGAALSVTWWLNRHFTFRVHRRKNAKEWGRYVLWNGLGASLNFLVYTLCLSLLPLDNPHQKALLSLILATAAALAFNYHAMRLAVFKVTPHE